MELNRNEDTTVDVMNGRALRGATTKRHVVNRNSKEVSTAAERVGREGQLFIQAPS